MAGAVRRKKTGGAVFVAGFSDINITVGADENILEIQSFFQFSGDDGIMELPSAFESTLQMVRE